MKIMLDTNILIYWLRNHSNSYENHFVDNRLHISLVTLGELYTGVKKSNKPKKNLTSLETAFSELDITTLPVELNTIETYSSVRAHLEKKGVRIDNFDLLIAATAISNKIPLLTENKKHFEKIPELKLID